MHPVLRINRNIVECKFRKALLPFRHYPELIETLWNVNKRRKNRSRIRKYELIETLWNVNMVLMLWQKAWIEGINRNIVECKYR